jgi:FixJ family two-component response regulator
MGFSRPHDETDAMQPNVPVIYVVEPLPEPQDHMVRRLASLDFAGRPLPHPDAQRLAVGSDSPACVIADPWHPDSMLDARDHIDRYERLPIIFVSERVTVPRAVEAMRAGAIDVLRHGCSDAALASAITAALEADRAHRAARSELARLQSRYATLTPREMEVLDLVVAGLLNKQSAWILGIREVTLQAHRCKVMEKMRAASLADLVRMADRLHLPPWSPSDSAMHLLRSRLSA